MRADPSILRDLRQKVEDDSVGALQRVLSLVSDPLDKVQISARAAFVMLACFSVTLESAGYCRAAGSDASDEDELWLTLCLLAHHIAGHDDPVSRGRRSFERLRATGVING